MTCHQRNWVFTLNFTGETPILSFGEETQYACWQHEKVDHDHLQGVIQLKKKTRLNGAKRLIGGNPHLEPMRGSITEAKAYCTKEQSRIAGPWEFGEMLLKGSNRRKLAELLDDPDNEINEPQKYRRAMAKSAMDESRKLAEEYDFPHELRSWQKTLISFLEEEPDDRTIYWVYGPNGGEGKTQFGKHLGLKKGWTYLPGGELKDMMYLYSKELKNHVVIDFPRCTKDFVSYKFLEMVKNRTVYSYKYEPIGSIVSNKVHVVVLCNFLPEEEKISGDRLIIINC
nr:replication-associated protein [Banana bunchy top virus associated alphasatellite 4]